MLNAVKIGPFMIRLLYDIQVNHVTSNYKQIDLMA